MAIIRSEHDMPPTASDRAMSVRHARDSVAFNKKHARDHAEAARVAQQRLSRVQSRGAGRR